MGMGASCQRWDCAALVEGGRPPTDPWYDCALQHSSAVSREREPEGVDIASPQELEVQLVCNHFAICRRGGGGSKSSSKRPAADWRKRYSLGRELGAGQTAIVFEAFTSAPSAEDPASDMGKAGGEQCANGYCQAAPSAAPRKGGGRKVALKRFFNGGSLMFRQEQRALTAVGVHPHILRLLESYQGGKDDDVLVLEHCDGGDVYDLYASNNGCCMLEAFVLQLIRQLLLALDHMVACGVEHRDVKPENLLLYGSSMDSMAVPQVKLADFGWAVVLEPGADPPAVPAEGVGSLWYAPPELNPPVNGLEQPGPGLALGGRSDMWSVGVITYLLLVGHSPFNPALRRPDPAEREQEVIRLAALGQINTSTRPWACLSDEARQFIGACIQPEPGKRLSPLEAWGHPFLARCHENLVEGSPCVAMPQQPSWDDRCERWKSLDGFQRLGWLAVARAVSEPELAEIPVLQLFVNQQGMGCTMYLEQLAVELAMAASPPWLQHGSAFGGVLALAFHYLDCDGDGHLSAGDLVQHVVGADGKGSAERWISKWRQGCCQSLPLQAGAGLEPSDLRRALVASCRSRTDVFAVTSSRRPELPEPDEEALEAALLGKSMGDVVLEKRMEAIDEVCQRFLDEEFDDFGYGF